MKAIFKTLKYSGVDMEDWLRGFSDVTESVKRVLILFETIHLWIPKVACSRTRRPSLILENLI